jgi:RNA polymerase sigma-70 factor, ECF subfamily
LQDQQAEKDFERDIRAHELLIRKICRIYAHTDADRQDLFQEIVLQLWRTYRNFSGRSKFSTWLYRVAINTAVTTLRKKEDFISPADPNQQPELATQEFALDIEERYNHLYAAIDQLGQIEKAIVMLYLEDRSYDEMEEILGITQGTLRVKMSRIKDKLRQLTKN